MAARLAYPAALAALFLAADVAYTWTLAEEPVASAPLADLIDRPDDLAIEIALAPEPVRHVRIVRLAEPSGGTFDLFGNWLRWGAHELELHVREGAT